MRYLFAVLPLFATLVAGFTFPDGLQDGVYRASTDVNGTEIHEVYKRSTAGSESGSWTPFSPTLCQVPREVHHARYTDVRRRVVVHPDPQETGTPREDTIIGERNVYCGCNNPLDHAQCDTATADLRAQIANHPTIDFGTSRYAVSGDVVVFACNFGQNGWGEYAAPINSDMLSVALSVIDLNCGEYVAGTDRDRARGQGISEVQAPWIGHSQFKGPESEPNAEFCTEAIYSAATCCPGHTYCQ